MYIPAHLNVFIYYNLNKAIIYECKCSNSNLTLRLPWQPLVRVHIAGVLLLRCSLLWGGRMQFIHKPVSCFDLDVRSLGSLQRSPVQRRHPEWCLAAGGLGWSSVLYRYRGVCWSGLRPCLSCVKPRQCHNDFGARGHVETLVPCFSQFLSFSTWIPGSWSRQRPLRCSETGRERRRRPIECCINPKHLSGFQHRVPLPSRPSALVFSRHPEDRCDSVWVSLHLSVPDEPSPVISTVCATLNWFCELRSRPSYWKRWAAERCEDG